MKTDRVVELTRLIEQRMSQLEALKNLAQNEQRHLTEEERVKYAALMDDVKTYSDELKLEQRELELRGVIEESRREPIRPNPARVQDERQRQYAEQGISLPPRELRFETFGEQLRAMVAASRPGGLVDRRLVRAASGMGEQVPSDGGFLVQQDFQAELMRRVYERSQILSRVRRIPISSNANSVKINCIDESSRVSSIWGGIILYWLDENAAKQDTHPKFAQLSLTLRKVAGLFYATDELLEDTAALGAVATEGFTEALDVELERVIIRGTGAGQPLGVLSSPCLITQAAETGQTAATIVYENLCNMWSKLWSRSMPNAIWTCSQSIFPQLMQMYVGTAASGTPVFLPPGGATSAPYGTIFGRPLIPIENASALGTVGDLILADFSQYLFADKGGPQVASSIHVRFANDETTFRLVFRCDGQPAWISDLTPKDNSGDVSPFVALATRS